jgi:hypothetical protein
MKGSTLTIAILFACLAESSAQEPSSEIYSNQGSVNLLIPVSHFAESHFAGICLQYAWSRNNFGNSTRLKSKFGAAVSGSLSHYFGARDDFGFRFFGLNYLEAYAGVQYHCNRNTIVVLSAGPAISQYRGHANMGIALKTEAGFYIKKRISINPSLRIFMHRNENGRWTPGIGAGYLF